MNALLLRVADCEATASENDALRQLRYRSCWCFSDYELDQALLLLRAFDGASGAGAHLSLPTPRTVGPTTAGKADISRCSNTAACPTFNPSMLVDLPGPARRYFLFAIASGTPLRPGAEIEMEGSSAGHARTAQIDAYEGAADSGASLRPHLAGVCRQGPYVHHRVRRHVLLNLVDADVAGSSLSSRSHERTRPSALFLRPAGRGVHLLGARRNASERPCKMGCVRRDVRQTNLCPRRHDSESGHCRRARWTAHQGHNAALEQCEP
jgi:hypothetical protein